MRSAIHRWRWQLLLACLEGGIVGGVLGNWQSLTGTRLTNRTAWTIAALYIALNLIAAIKKGLEESRTANELDAGPKSVAEEKRTFVEDSEGILELARLDGWDAIRRFTPYLGKWMTISGAFDGMAESFGRDSLHVTLILDDGRRVNLRFTPDRGDQLRQLRQGQRIIAICQIQYRSSFTPENCELIRVEPVKRADGRMLALAS